MLELEGGEAMSEYIITYEQLKRLFDWINKLSPDEYKRTERLELYTKLEVPELVRCRDCKHYRKHKWFEVVVGVPLGTDFSDVCMLFADGCKVEPNGFCAWGERKVDE